MQSMQEQMKKQVEDLKREAKDKEAAFQAQLELLKKDLKDAQQKAEEAKKAPESKEVQPSLPAESVGETSEMDTQKSDGWFKEYEDPGLGASSVDLDDRKVIHVDCLEKGGLFEAWNDKCLATGELDSVVRPGDLIISCNGVTKIEEMAQELFGSKKTLHIGLLREAEGGRSSWSTRA
eukprot:g24527.t1